MISFDFTFVPLKPASTRLANIRNARASEFSPQDGEIRRQILEAAENLIQLKLDFYGLSSVVVRVSRLDGEQVRLQFSGPAKDVKKAKALFKK
jgi:hypothetical protein